MDRLRAMEAFVRVVDAGSFSEAARRWSVSKAVVSKYVSGLESHLGVSLLQRTTRSLSLTETGRDYYRRCADLLGELDDLEAGTRAQHVAPGGLLRVTAPPGFMSRYGALMTTELVREFPLLRLEIHLTHRMLDLVDEGFDVAIRVTAPRDSSMIARRLADAPLVAVASPDYLARRGTPTRAASLRDHDCLVDTNFRDRGRWRFRGGGSDEHVEVDGPIRVNSPTAVRDLAIAGHGIALVPAFVADDALERGALVELLPGQIAFDWAIYAVYPRRRHLPARVRAFVDHMRDGLGSAKHGRP